MVNNSLTTITDPYAMKIFHTAKRIGYHSHWEPFFIATPREPYFDERLTWEGKSDKHTLVITPLKVFTVFVKSTVKVLVYELKNLENTNLARFLLVLLKHGSNAIFPQNRL